jgi:hypothetical protein
MQWAALENQDAGRQAGSTRAYAGSKCAKQNEKKKK